MDVFKKKKRSWIMSRIKGRNTAPEKKIRAVVRKLGYKIEMNVKDLPGKPDIVIKDYKKAIFIHGCFWHGHKNCKRAKLPATNKKFWENKIGKTIFRDKKNLSGLKKLGWEYLVIWQCKISDKVELEKKIQKFIVKGENNE